MVGIKVVLTIFLDNRKHCLLAFTLTFRRLPDLTMKNFVAGPETGGKQKY